jgi:tetratricopeptide (TPR) repeat protein
MREKIRIIFWIFICVTVFASAQSKTGNRDEQFNAAKAAYQSSRFEECIFVTTRLIQQQPSRAELYELRGQAREQIKDFKGAITDLSIACGLEPENPAFRFSRGLMAYQNGRTDLAREDFRSLLRKKTTETNTIYFRVNSNLGVDRMVTLESDLRAQLLHYLGLNEIKAGNFGRAVELLDSAITIEPNDADMFAHRALALNKSGAPELASADLRKAFGYSDNHAYAYANQSRMMAEQGNPDGAEQAINEAIRSNNRIAEFYAERANIYLTRNNIGAARSDYDSAILLSPDDADLWYNRGIVNEKSGQLNLALEDYRKAIQLSENYKQAWFMSANILLKQGKFGLAIEDYTVALNLEPDYSPALNNRGIAYFKSGDKTSACKDWSSAAKNNFEPSVQFTRTHCKN